ncbi:hypothetical protein J4Q44_G00326320 [Coregonus suidteri]|uniref:Uncharacterized protein n=1 Tax=Coregonus suidteri TaxID=861788 RepID=A0AAN8KWA3_9TELE
MQSMEKFQKRMDEAEIAVPESASPLPRSSESRFLKPADDDDGDGVSAPAPARNFHGFLKPVSDDEESDRKSSGPAWRKSSSGQKSASGKPRAG